jgi:microcystin-dependent protein
MREEQSASNEEGTRRNFVIRSLQAILGLGAFSLVGSLKLFGQNKGLTQKKPSISSVQSTQPFLGEIQITAGNVVPTGWALCNGQLLSISSNAALFSLLGTTYGGNGATTFALPNLQARMPFGVSTTDSNFLLGSLGGEASHTLTLNEIPLHTHSFTASSANGTSPNPSGTFPAQNSQGIRQYSGIADTSMNPAAVSSIGSTQPHNNLPPYLVLNFIIALVGIFPSRS